MLRFISIVGLILLQATTLPGARASWEFCLSKMDFCATASAAGGCRAEPEAVSCCETAVPESPATDHGCCIDAESGELPVLPGNSALTVEPAREHATPAAWERPAFTHTGAVERTAVPGDDPSPPTATQRLRWLQVRLN